MPPSVSHRSAAVAGLSCALLALTWQFLTVRYNYHNDWSGLFCTGEHAVLSEMVAAEHPYRFAGAERWDGQLYHEIAHDPLMERGSVSYIAGARLRYRRILIPGLAHVLSGGNDAGVDVVYRSVVILFFALGGFWLSWLLQAAGRPPAWGLVFVLLPASIASLDREAVDVGLLAFCCAFAVYTREAGSPKILYTVLLLAGLVRETGLLLTGAYCLWLLFERDFRKSALFATAAVPAFGWYWFVSRRTPPNSEYGSIAIPFSGVLHRLTHRMAYFGNPLKVTLIQSMDFLAAAGVLAAMIWAFRVAWRRRLDPVQMAIVLFALLGLLAWEPGNWLEALDYARILSPLLLFEALLYLDGSGFVALAPLCMVLPRFGIQMGAQVAGVVKGLAGG